MKYFSIERPGQPEELAGRISYIRKLRDLPEGTRIHFYHWYHDDLVEVRELPIAGGRVQVSHREIRGHTVNWAASRRLR